MALQKEFIMIHWMLSFFPFFLLTIKFWQREYFIGTYLWKYAFFSWVSRFYFQNVCTITDINCWTWKFKKYSLRKLYKINHLILSVQRVLKKISYQHDTKNKQKEKEDIWLIQPLKILITHSSFHCKNLFFTNSFSFWWCKARSKTQQCDFPKCLFSH